MAIVNGPAGGGGPFPKVTVGKRTKIGSITAAGNQLQFGLSEQSFYHCGSIIIQSVPQAPGGTITTFTADIRLSLDGGVTFAAQSAVGAATVASNTAGLNFQTTPLQSIAIPGVGGELSLQFVAVTFVLGTATSADIWVLLG